MLLSVFAFALAAPPTPQAVSLFATPEALAAGEPTAVIRAGVRVAEGTFGFWGLAGSIPVAHLALRPKDARVYGQVYAFEADGVTWLNPDRPIVSFWNDFGAVTRVGDAAVAERLECYWVQDNVESGHEHCDLVVELVDASRWTTTRVDRWNLPAILSDAPALAEEFDAARPKDTRTVRRYLVRYLAERSG